MNTGSILNSLEYRFRAGYCVPVKTEYISLVIDGMKERGLPLWERSREKDRAFFMSEAAALEKGYLQPPVKKKRGRPPQAK
jgi:hypothetical protein